MHVDAHSSAATRPEKRRQKIGKLNSDFLSIKNSSTFHREKMGFLIYLFIKPEFRQETVRPSVEILPLRHRARAPIWSGRSDKF